MASLIEELQKEYGDKISRRIDEYKKATALYIKLSQKDVPAGKVVFKDDAETLLAILYFKWHRLLVKPFIKDLCDRYKVASLTEFAVCYAQPIVIEGYSPEQLRAINADFAFFCAFNIMANFDDESESLHFGQPHVQLFAGAIFSLEDRMEKVLENHKRYLATYDDTNASPPVISNAHCLELVDMIYQVRWQALAV